MPNISIRISDNDSFSKNNRLQFKDFADYHFNIKISLNFICTTIHRYPLWSSEIEHGSCACTIDNPSLKLGIISPYRLTNRALSLTLNSLILNINVTIYCSYARLARLVRCGNKARFEMATQLSKIVFRRGLTEKIRVRQGLTTDGDQ